MVRVVQRERLRRRTGYGLQDQGALPARYCLLRLQRLLHDFELMQVSGGLNRLTHLTDNPFVKYVANNPLDARNHFYALKEAVPDLKGVALYDRLVRQLQSIDLQEIMWQRREIENYLPIPSVVERYFEKQGSDLSLIRELMNDYMPPIAKKDKKDSWWFDTKMSDDFLDKIFRQYFQRLKQPVSLMSKSNYYELALLSEPNELDGEVLEKLEALFLMFRE